MILALLRDRRVRGVARVDNPPARFARRGRQTNRTEQTVMSTITRITVGVCTAVAVVTLGACGSTTDGSSGNSAEVNEATLQAQADVCSLVGQGYSVDQILASLEENGTPMTASLENAITVAAGRC